MYRNLCDHQAVDVLNETNKPRSDPGADTGKPFSNSVHEAAEAIAAAGSAAGAAAIKLEVAAVDAIEEELARRPRWRTALSIVGWTLVAGYFAFAAALLGLRYWVLPNIDQYTHLIESRVSEIIGERVTIGAVSAGWDGLRPELDLQDVRVFDGKGEAVLSLPAVEAVLSWSSMLLGSVHFHSLTLDRPDLAVRRDGGGRFHVAGMQLKSPADGGPDFSAWLLKQNEVSIRGAGIVWTDEQRAAPPLHLSGVGFVLRNSGSTHRFALQAAVPRELASKLDVRGELVGRDLQDLDQWSGKLYAELEYIDLGAWKHWLDYPLELRSGEGGLRLWLAFARGQMTEMTADVALARVTTRAAAGLPLLELDYLRGRLGAKRGAAGAPPQTEVFGKQLTLRSKGGVALPPADFALKLQPGKDTDRKNDSGEFSADALSLQPLAKLAEYLPLPDLLRKQLDAADPRGSVHDLRLSWKGQAEQLQEYSLRGSFNALAMRARGKLPGFSGLSGTVNASQKSGSLSLIAARSPVSGKTEKAGNRERSSIELPGVVADGGLRFDALSGRLDWSLAPDRKEFRFSDVTFANADAAGSLSGSFVAKPDSAGMIDLSASLSRADGRSVWRYIPWIPDSLRDYLRSAIVAGQSRDMQLRLKGDLDDFPFDDARRGRFQVTARINEGELNYAEGWPRISGIAGELAIDGRKLSIRAQRGTTLGARLSNVRATIPDLLGSDPQLAVEGQADGPVAEFLRFVEVSPVTRYIDGVSQDVRASGNGRLQLKLDLPLDRLDAVKVAGNVQFQNGQVTINPELPPFTQVNGRVEFSETGMNIRGITAQFLGGPVMVNAQTLQTGGVGITAQGTAAMPAVRRLVNVAALDHFTGSAPWRSSITARRGVMDITVESPLQGVTIDLPPPFGKTAVETLPLRLDMSNGTDAETIKRFRGLRAPAKGDVLMLSLGNLPGRSVNALLARRPEGRSSVIDRGTISLNEAATAPTAAGVTVNGSLAYLDTDRWQQALGSVPAGATGAAAAAASPGTANVASVPGLGPAGLAGINLRIATLDIAGKRINDLGLRAQPRGPQWNATVEARELKGEVRWRPEGRGVVQARLSHLIAPGDRPATPGASAIAESITRELPALDIVADSFTLKDRHLGKLELVAVNEVRDWRIEKLILSNPESLLSVDGVWQSWAARPSISVNVKLETSDLGVYLDRMGYPKLMQNGTSKLEGKVGWAGNPQSPDFSTLTGTLKLSAEKGQFLKADPGVAKLLGVLSLQSLVTLDLRDLFREGFAYDSISGTAVITKGIATTGDFFMKGSAAQVQMSGSIDLARETQNLHLRVVPSLGDGASTITGVILANPIFGIGLTLLQRLLKNPLGQIFAVEYDVTGSWDDPKVTRTKVDTPVAATPP